MERTEEYEFDSAGSLGTAVDQSVEFLETDLAEHEHLGAEAVYTDDPVRVYLREMGAVRLLNRQGEIDLALRMERGKNRMHKALSRSPLVWRGALGLFEEVQKGGGLASKILWIWGRPTMTPATRRASKSPRALPGCPTLNKSLVELKDRYRLDAKPARKIGGPS